MVGRDSAGNFGETLWLMRLRIGGLVLLFICLLMLVVWRPSGSEGVVVRVVLHVRVGGAGWSSDIKNVY